MNRRKTLAVMIGGLALGAGVNRAGGDLITWEFAGQITEVRDDDGSLGGVFSIGSPFSGQYTFESTTPDGSPVNPTFGRYEDAVTSISGIVGEVPFIEIPGLTSKVAGHILSSQSPLIRGVHLYWECSDADS